MKTITIECDTEWQAKLLSQLAQFMMAEHPFAGSPKGACVILNVRFEGGSANAAMAHLPGGFNLDMESYMWVEAASVARHRVIGLLSHAGIPENEAGEMFNDFVKNAADKAAFGEHSDSQTTNEALAKARKRFNQNGGAR